jgi:hypothetical protein
MQNEEKERKRGNNDGNSQLTVDAISLVDDSLSRHFQTLSTKFATVPHVKIDESNESWVEVCRRSSKIKSSLRKAKYERDGG